MRQFTFPSESELGGYHVATAMSAAAQLCHRLTYVIDRRAPKLSISCTQLDEDTHPELRGLFVYWSSVARNHSIWASAVQPTISDLTWFLHRRLLWPVLCV